MKALILGIEGALGYDIQEALESKGWEVFPIPAPGKHGYIGIRKLDILEMSNHVDLVVGSMEHSLLRILQSAWQKRKELRIILCAPVLSRDASLIGRHFGAERVEQADRIVGTLLDPPPTHLGV